MAAIDALQVPIRNKAYRHYFAIRDNANDLVTSWTGQDSEVSKDGGNYTDGTNEATEIQSSGTGYIDLTATEMNAALVLLKVTVTNSNAKPYLAGLYTEGKPVAAATASSITLDSSETYPDDALIGGKVTILAGTGVGQSRPIEDWVLATKVATIPSAYPWDVNPDTTSIYKAEPAVANVMMWKNQIADDALEVADLFTGGQAINSVAGVLEANLVQVIADAVKASKFSDGLDSIITGTVDDTGFTPVQNQFETSDITEATADHFLNKTVYWKSGGNLYRQSNPITAYSLSGGRGRFTTSDATEAAANGDAFFIA